MRKNECEYRGKGTSEDASFYLCSRVKNKWVLSED